MINNDQQSSSSTIDSNSLSDCNNFIAITQDFSQEGLLEEIIYKSSSRSDFFIIVLIVRGSASFKINFKEFNVRINQVLIIPSDSNKENLFISNDALFKIVAYTSDFLIPLHLPDNFWEMTDYFSSKSIPIWNLTKEEVVNLTDLIDRMAHQKINLNQHFFGRHILNYTFMVFILEIGALAKVHDQPSNQRYSRKESLTIDFYTLVKRHFRENRSVNYYAKLLFMTPKYLTETIKEITGKTAGEIIDSMVIKESCMQLNLTTKSISQISSDLNFSDQSFFGKYFKRHTGVSPREHRELR